MWPEYDQIKNNRSLENIKMEVNKIIWYNEHKILLDNTLYVKGKYTIKKVSKKPIDSFVG